MEDKMLLWSQQTYLDTVERVHIEWLGGCRNGFCLPAYCYPSSTMDGVAECHDATLLEQNIRWWTTDWEVFDDGKM